MGHMVCFTSSSYQFAVYGIRKIAKLKSLSTVKPVKNGCSQKDRKLVFKTNISLNAGQKYCRMLQGEHSAILLTFISYHLPLISLFCLFLRNAGQVGLSQVGPRQVGLVPY